jgi:hypothetical protein
MPVKKNLASLLAVSFLSIVFSSPLIGQDQHTVTQSSTTQAPGQATAAPLRIPRPCANCVRAHMEFLASDALRGRGSGTADELIAATYAASQLREYGIAPAGDQDGYIQRAVLQQPKLTAPPQLTFTQPGAAEQSMWTYGKEFTVLRLSKAQFSGPLHVIEVEQDDAQVS